MPSHFHARSTGVLSSALLLTALVSPRKADAADATIEAARTDNPPTTTQAQNEIVTLEQRLATLGFRLANPNQSQSSQSTNMESFDFQAPFQAFQSPSSNVKALGLGDLTGDVIPDMAVACTDSNEVVIYKGDANGIFEQLSITPTAASPSSIALARLDGNSSYDVAVGHNQAGGRAGILLNAGSGSVGAETLVGSSFPGFAPRTVAISQVTGSAANDLLVAFNGGDTVPGKVEIETGNGDGTFTSGGVYVTGNGPRDIAVADITGDGIPDIVTANASSVSVLPGTGAGYAAPLTFPTPSSGSLRSDVVADDFNGDGRVDLGVACGASRQVRVLINDGTPSLFSSGTNYSATSSGGGPTSVVSGDFNRDGIPDLATSQQTGESQQALTLLPGVGDGTFGPRINFAVKGGGALASGQIDQDTNLDLVIAGMGDRVVAITNPDSALGKSEITDIGTGATDARLVNYSGAGSPHDLVVYKAESGGTPARIEAYQGHDGTFSLLTTFSCGPWRGANISVGDLNNDSHPDILVSGANAGSPVEVYYGNGDGSFYAGPTQTATGTDVEIADVNGDGKKDLVTITKDSNSLTVALQGSGGNLGTPQTQWTSSNPSVLKIADANGDGRVDALVLNDPAATTGSLSVFLGNGTSSFQSPLPDVQLGFHPTDLATGLLNQDATPDLVIGSRDGAIETLMGSSGGLFAPQQQFTTEGSDKVLVGDFDGDYHPDIAAAGPASGRAALFVGNGAGWFSWSLDVGTGGTSPIGLMASDFNGDSRPDLIVLNSLGSGVGATDDGSISLMLDESAPRAIVGVDTSPPNSPVGDLRLSSPYPNPAHQNMRIALTIPEHCEMNIEIVDCAGRRIKSLFDGRLEPGTHEFHWDTSTDSGHHAPPGEYFVRARTHGQSRVAKIVSL